MNKAAARGVVVAAACVAAAVSATTSTVMFHECVVNPTACDAADTATAFLQVFGTRKSSPSVGDPTVTVFTRDLVADTKRYDEKARKTVTDKAHCESTPEAIAFEGTREEVLAKRPCEVGVRNPLVCGSGRGW